MDIRQFNFAQGQQECAGREAAMATLPDILFYSIREVIEVNVLKVIC